MAVLTSADSIKLGSTVVDKVYMGSTQVWTSVDSDAAAFLTASGITDSTQSGAVNRLVLDLKAASIWTKMAAIYPLVGGTAAKHKWNL